MAITTISGAVSSMMQPIDFVKQATGTLVGGRPISLFYLAGTPAAATAPSPGIDGAALTTYTGQLPFTNPLSGNTYLARMQAQASIPGTLMLCDRLWHNSGYNVTLTTEQTSNAAQIPARDNNGTNNGVGVYAGVEVATALGNGTPTFTLKYTNSSGTAGQTATNTIATANGPVAGTFFPIGLANGDVGIQKVESLTLSATYTSGKIGVVLYRVIARLEIGVTGGIMTNAIDAVTAGFPRLYDNSVPFLIFNPNGVNSTNINGHIILSQG